MAVSEMLAASCKRNSPWPRLRGALIVVGVVLIAVQLAYELSAPDFTPNIRQLEVERGGRLKLGTSYIGLVVLDIGAVLETVGYVASTPWKRSMRGGSTNNSD